MLKNLYSPSLALLTDLYQLTMAYGYWKTGTQDKQAVFHLYFRNNPFAGGYTIACGLADAIEYLDQLHFTEDDLAYVASLRGNDGEPLFDAAFIDSLRKFQFACDIDSIPEGTVVFPNEPLVRVRGPIWQCQLLETPLLNLINFPTLIATKASRICLAAQGSPVIEFGLRRAQGIDGSLTATRAAYVGGCVGTSSVLAGKLLGIKVLGTHAHSWVMSFPTESAAFEEYARAMPNNCVFLVDTFNTLDGVRHAARVGKQLKAAGHKMVGIRLDSGDLAYLSIEARKILDEAGLTDATITASNDLDETLIESLKHQGAKINVWGVGTHLSTAYDQPALGGVYKLGAIRNTVTEPWEYKIKLSEQIAKTSIPGIQQIRRFTNDGQFIGDCIYDERLGVGSPITIIDPRDVHRFKTVPPDADGEDLLVSIYRNGKRVYDSPPLQSARQRTLDQLSHLHPTIKRLANPHGYPAGLAQSLSDLRTKLIRESRST